MQSTGAALGRGGSFMEEALRGPSAGSARYGTIFPIFGQEANPAFVERGNQLSTHQRDEIFERAITPAGGQASAYQRLKLAMDYWCSLWFWPVEQGDMMPTRDEFLLEMSAILEGTSQELSPLLGPEQQPLFATGRPEQQQLRLAEELGQVNLEELCASLPRLKTGPGTGRAPPFLSLGARLCRSVRGPRWFRSDTRKPTVDQDRVERRRCSF